MAPTIIQELVKLTISYLPQCQKELQTAVVSLLQDTLETADETGSARILVAGSYRMMGRFPQG